MGKTTKTITPRELYCTQQPIYPIGLGAMRLSISGRPDYQQALEVLRTFIDQGGQFIDTADVYCIDDSERGHNEQLLAKALRELNCQDKVIIATKGGMYRPQGEWRIDARPEVLRESCERSLKNLGIEPIEIYQLHTVDPSVPLLDSVGELTRLQEEGKIRHIGLSNVNLAQLKEAQREATIVTVQNQFNLAEQDDLHNGLITYCREQAINFLPYRPLGAYRVQQELLESNTLVQLAHHYDCLPQQLMLGWLLHLGDHILPIPGTRSPEHMTELMATPQFDFNHRDLLQIENAFLI